MATGCWQVLMLCLCLLAFPQRRLLIVVSLPLGIALLILNIVHNHLEVDCIQCSQSLSVFYSRGRKKNVMQFTMCRSFLPGQLAYIEIITRARSSHECMKMYAKCKGLTDASIDHNGRWLQMTAAEYQMARNARVLLLILADLNLIITSILIYVQLDYSNSDSMRTLCRESYQAARVSKVCVQNADLFSGL